MNKKNEKYSGLTDEQVVAAYKQSGDKQFVGELFNRYGPLVFGVCLKYLKNKVAAEDMVMSIFEKLIKLLIEKEVQNFRSWLHVVSRNECLMLLRKQGKIRENSLDESTELEANGSEVDAKQLQEVKLSRLEEAVKKLKEKQRICVELFYLQDKCYQDVADATGFSLKEVKSNIQNGKRNLKILLSQLPEFANQNPSHE